MSYVPQSPMESGRAPLNTTSNLNTMQKLINVLAVVSFGVSAAVVAGGVYVYQNQEALVDSAKKQVTDAVKDLLSQSELGSVLVGGSSDVDVTDEALDVDSNPPVEIPVVPF